MAGQHRILSLHDLCILLNRTDQVQTTPLPAMNPLWKFKSFPVLCDLCRYQCSTADVDMAVHLSNYHVMDYIQLDDQMQIPLPLSLLAILSWRIANLSVPTGPQFSFLLTFTMHENKTIHQILTGFKPCCPKYSSNLLRARCWLPDEACYLILIF